MMHKVTGEERPAATEEFIEQPWLMAGAAAGAGLAVGAATGGVSTTGVR